MKDSSTVRTFYYKALDVSGHKRTGTVEADSTHAAEHRLRDKRLKPYFVYDYKKLKKEFKRRKKRRSRIAIAGGISIAAALAVSLLLGRYAGTDRALTMDELERAGLIEAASGLVTAGSPEHREYGAAVYALWNEICPGGVSGLEVKKMLLTIYVTPEIYTLSEGELDVIASATIRTHHKNLGAQNPTLYLIEDTMTILEANYFGFTRKVRVKSYR